MNRSRATLAALGLALVALAGCSDDADPAEEGSETTEAVATTVDGSGDGGTATASSPPDDGPDDPIADYLLRHSRVVFVAPPAITDTELGCIAADLDGAGHSEEIAQLDASQTDLWNGSAELNDAALVSFQGCLNDRFGEVIGFDGACLAEQLADAEEVNDFLENNFSNLDATVVEALGYDEATWVEAGVRCRDRSPFYAANEALGMTAAEAVCVTDAQVDGVAALDVDDEAAIDAAAQASFDQCLDQDRQVELGFLEQ